MYSIFGLGSVMCAEGFGIELPSWLTPLITFAIVGHFFRKSVMEARREDRAKRDS